MANVAEKLAQMKKLAKQLALSDEQLMLYQAIETVLEEIAMQLDENAQAFDEYAQVVEDMDAFIDRIVEEMDDEAVEDADEEDGEALLELECPQCGYHIIYDVQSLAADPEPKCPKCATALFEEESVEEEE